MGIDRGCQREREMENGGVKVAQQAPGLTACLQQQKKARQGSLEVVDGAMMEH